MRTPVILVGVDGSLESRAALRWALEEAPRRGARVEAMLAYQLQPAFVPATAMGFNPHGDMPQRHPARELHDAVQHVRTTMTDAPDVTETVVVGDAASHLAIGSKHAELIVIGNRGRGRVAEFVSSGITADCVRHAACPVVVIPAKTRS